ncbi:MAG: GDP-mannose 4,6-dehydratase [Candidatus Doudnabacteria bacterium]|nr:GDP-mannose 4,6-dehydratase [Candidatus Doudnabacteria bacterium]
MITPQKTALITGITGQDGSYLAEFLLAKGYSVHGIMRRASTFNTGRIEQIYQDPHMSHRRLFLHYGDLSDASNLNQLIKTIKPIEIYNLGAQSHVKVSFEIPEFTSNVDALGTLRLLDAVRDSGVKTKIYQAGSSEMFGEALEKPQTEKTPFNPVSPYAAAKVFAHQMCKIYRDSYGMFICNGILFNHESERRGKTFVTRKITAGIAAILAGKQDKIFLGNLDAKRDWGYAPEYVKAMWLMLQKSKPDDYVIATGETHSIREFLDVAFGLVGKKNWKPFVSIDPAYYRPSEVDYLLGNAGKAKKQLGWRPKVKFKELVRIMMEADLRDAGLNPAQYLI